jgi:hypothetical protein
MPLTEKEVLGTEKNGDLSNEYCSYCYKDGDFLKPEETMEEMIETCVPFMVQDGMKEEEARRMLNEFLPTLKRWKKV